MSFNFGTAKTAFALPTSTALPGTGAGGDTGADGQNKLAALFGTPTVGSAVPQTTITTGVTLPTTTTTAGFGFRATIAPAAKLPQFGLGSALSTSLTTTATTTSTAFTLAAPSTGFALGTTPSLGTVPATTTTVAPLSFTGLGTTAPATTTGGLSFSLGGLTTTTATSSALPSTGTLTFAQLEDAINKWTVDLEEQGKVFNNQAKHLNAWDRLLMSNGEKIMNVNNGVERIKQQQAQLDQELDFVLAQHKELEDCIVPLEKEYQDVPVTDVERDQTYKLAENIDAQLKQMSEDIKEIIEQLNESNKTQEMSDPVVQIGRILNAHMNSLQWIDRHTLQISTHLDEISKLHDMNRRNHENLHGA